MVLIYSGMSCSTMPSLRRDLRTSPLKAMLFAEYTAWVDQEHAVIQRVNHVFERCLGLKCHFNHIFQNRVRLSKRNF